MANEQPLFQMRSFDDWMENKSPQFDLAVAMGKVEGVLFEHKFGLNEAVTGAYATIWTITGIATYLASASVLKISSSSTADDSPSGTGALTINIAGLDGNYNPIDENVILNGRTEVNTIQTFLRVHRMKLLTAGSGATNAGVIYAGTGTVTTGVPANKYGAIAIGYGKTLQAMYTIRAGYTGWLYHVDVSADVSQAIVPRVMVRPLGGVFVVEGEKPFLDGVVSLDWRFPLEIEEKSDIEVQALATASGGAMGASFDILLTRNQ